jgi:hypothetical protein
MAESSSPLARVRRHKVVGVRFSESQQSRRLAKKNTFKMESHAVRARGWPDSASKLRRTNQQFAGRSDSRRMK